jgi:hypothetical protein
MDGNSPNLVTLVSLAPRCSDQISQQNATLSGTHLIATQHPGINAEALNLSFMKRTPFFKFRQE